MWLTSRMQFLHGRRGHFAFASRQNFHLSFLSHLMSLPMSIAIDYRIDQAIEVFSLEQQSEEQLIQCARHWDSVERKSACFAKFNLCLVLAELYKRSNKSLDEKEFYHQHCKAITDGRIEYGYATSLVIPSKVLANLCYYIEKLYHNNIINSDSPISVTNNHIQFKYSLINNFPWETLLQILKFISGIQEASIQFALVEQIIHFRNNCIDTLNMNRKQIYSIIIKNLKNLPTLSSLQQAKEYFTSVYEVLIEHSDRNLEIKQYVGLFVDSVIQNVLTNFPKQTMVEPILHKELSLEQKEEKKVRNKRKEKDNLESDKSVKIPRKCTPVNKQDAIKTVELMKNKFAWDTIIKHKVGVNEKNKKTVLYLVNWTNFDCSDEAAENWIPKDNMILNPSCFKLLVDYYEKLELKRIEETKEISSTDFQSYVAEATKEERKLLDMMLQIDPDNCSELSEPEPELMVDTDSIIAAK
jgi:hypothetical protein